jgi:Flp pilus assembly protein TadD
MVTFTKDIAALVFEHCAACHRPGGGAPFSLMTYEDVRQRATQIKAVTTSRYMPPWKPEPGYGEFAGARRLTDEQLTLIQRWVDTGAVEGDPKDLRPVPRWPGEWQLGKPDLIVTMPEPYFLRDDGPDVFRTFVIPIPLSEGRYVKALEFNPGTHQHAVHHANIKIDRTRSSRWLDEAQPGPGYDGGGGRDARFPDGYFLGWTPGQLPRISPDDMAWRVEPGTDLVVELHMLPTGTQQPVQISVGLSFTDQPPARLPYMLRLGRQDIDIPAGEREHVVADTFVLPVDVEALAVQPHAHNLAKEISGFALLPDRTTKWLIYIKAWDFGWQDVYRYAKPLLLPKGTTLVMQYTYDNSAGNLRNPNRPPRRVTFGQTTSSEMGDLWIQAVPLRTEDRALLDKEYARKMLAEDTAGYEKMLEVDPEDARAHYDLAFCYLEVGRVSDAIAHLEEVARLEPNSAWADYELGIVLLRQKRLDEAAQHLRQAVKLKSDFSEAYNNLGVVSHVQGKVDEASRWYGEALRVQPDNIEARFNLARVRAAQGQVDEAIVEYRQVLRIKPDDAEAHSGLGSLLASHGQIDEALVHFRRALLLRPDLPTAVVDLAWILATSDRADIRAPTEAVRLAERGVELTEYQNATVLNTLAVAYAAAGRFDQAINTAQVALDLASAGGDQELAGQIREHLITWRARQ